MGIFHVWSHLPQQTEEEKQHLSEINSKIVAAMHASETVNFTFELLILQPIAER